MPDFIPETAPFNAEQRAWLNGFFSGLMGLQQIDTASVAQVGNQVLQQGEWPASAAVGTLEAPLEEEDYPWHDPAIPLAERQELAAGQPTARKLMAAMAQLDCGSCGYVCQTYAEALAAGSETNTSLCSPGGKETRQLVKLLLQEHTASATTESAAGADDSATDATIPVASGYSRQNPFAARLIESKTLNQPGSAKDVRHVVFDLKDSGLIYEVGDALGVYPVNCRELSLAILDRLGVDPQAVVRNARGIETTLLESLLHEYCLRDPSDELLQLLLERTESVAVRAELQRLLTEGTPEGFDVLEALELTGEAPVGLAVEEFLSVLEPLNPRLYSIASSMREVDTEVHLTVGTVRYERGGRLRQGVASTLLGGRLPLGEQARVFVQPNHGGFTVPANDAAPLIMVGPGTGIAPFRAFLQERAARKASGPNWLFFGDQHQAYDFLYEEELAAYQAAGVLTRLETAFSRDGERKVYVQDRLQQHAGEVFAWLEAGGYFMVCGDASRMARDVEQTLLRIFEEHAKTDAAGARRYLKELASAGRYVRDVY